MQHWIDDCNVDLGENLGLVDNESSHPLAPWVHQETAGDCEEEVRPNSSVSFPPTPLDNYGPLTPQSFILPPTPFTQDAKKDGDQNENVVHQPGFFSTDFSQTVGNLMDHPENDEEADILDNAQIDGRTNGSLGLSDTYEDISDSEISNLMPLQSESCSSIQYYTQNLTDLSDDNEPPVSNSLGDLLASSKKAGTSSDHRMSLMEFVDRLPDLLRRKRRTSESTVRGYGSSPTRRRYKSAAQRGQLSDNTAKGASVPNENLIPQLQPYSSGQSSETAAGQSSWAHIPAGNENLEFNDFNTPAKRMRHQSLPTVCLPGSMYNAQTAIPNSAPPYIGMQPFTLDILSHVDENGNILQRIVSVEQDTATDKCKMAPMEGMSSNQTNIYRGYEDLPECAFNAGTPAFSTVDQSLNCSSPASTSIIPTPSNMNFVDFANQGSNVNSEHNFSPVELLHPGLSAGTTAANSDSTLLHGSYLAELVSTDLSEAAIMPLTSQAITTMSHTVSHSLTNGFPSQSESQYAEIDPHYETSCNQLSFQSAPERDDTLQKMVNEQDNHRKYLNISPAIEGIDTPIPGPGFELNSHVCSNEDVALVPVLMKDDCSKPEVIQTKTDKMEPNHAIHIHMHTPDSVPQNNNNSTLSHPATLSRVDKHLVRKSDMVNKKETEISPWFVDDPIDTPVNLQENDSMDFGVQRNSNLALAQQQLSVSDDHPSSFECSSRGSLPCVKDVALQSFMPLQLSVSPSKSAATSTVTSKVMRVGSYRNEVYFQAAMASEAFPKAEFQCQYKDTDLAPEDMQTGSKIPSVKQELKQIILARRQQEGKGEIDINFSPPPQTELTEEEKQKKKHRQELNKKAALKHRDRKKMKLQSIEKECEEEEKRNSELREVIERLEQEKFMYTSKLQDCGISVPAGQLN